MKKIADTGYIWHVLGNERLKKFVEESIKHVYA